LTAAFPTPVTDSGDDRPISGHGNGFAKLHVHDGVVGSRKGAATAVVVTIDWWREMLMASERVTPRYARQIRYDNNRGAVRRASAYYLSAGCCRVSVDVTHTSFRPAGATVRYVDVLDTGVG